MAGPSWDKDSVSSTLDDSIALDTIVLVQPLPQLGIQVGALVMNGIVMGVQSSSLFYCYFVEQISDLVGVSRVEDMP